MFSMLKENNYLLDELERLLYFHTEAPLPSQEVIRAYLCSAAFTTAVSSIRVRLLLNPDVQ